MIRIDDGDRIKSAGKQDSHDLRDRSVRPYEARVAGHDVCEPEIPRQKASAHTVNPHVHLFYKHDAVLDHPLYHGEDAVHLRGRQDDLDLQGHVEGEDLDASDRYLTALVAARYAAQNEAAGRYVQIVYALHKRSMKGPPFVFCVLAQ